MPLKVIKKDAAASSQVKRLYFSGDPATPEPAELELPPWLTAAEPKTDSPHTNATKESAVQAPAPQVDLALVEKTAYENGFRQGEKAGMEIAERKIEAQMRRYAEAIGEVGKLKTKLYSQVEREVVKLAVEVAKKIVHREIQADREIIQTLVKVALGHVAEKSAVTVHLHPTDYNFLLEHRAEFSQTEGGREFVLLADKSMERGGCLIQTECGDIDARIEEKFREVERAFFENQK